MMNSDLNPPNLTTLLANFCANHELHTLFPTAAIRMAELAIADTIGCILAGVDDPAVVKMGTIIPDENSGLSNKSSSIRHKFPVSSRDAAMVNGCAAHARELDDNVMPAAIHSSAILTPALLALGEEIGASGADVVRAFIVGMEVNAQIGKLVNPSHHSSGWHTISTIGVIGNAAACATLLRLRSEQIIYAMSIAFSKAAGSKLQFGSEVKPMHSGFSPADGILAAKLAASGGQGNTDIFQGKWSFQDLYAGGAWTGIFLPTLFPDAPLAIDEFPPVAKLYPCCGSSHLGIGALRELRTRHMFSNDGITRIDIHMHKVMTENLRYRIPANEMEARFSMPYCAAVTLVHGMPRLPHFTPDAISNPDPEISRLMPLVQTHVRNPSPEASKLPFMGDCLVKIHLASGEVLETIAKYPKGCEENPLTLSERHEKFVDCASSHLGKERAHKLFPRLLEISRIGPITQISQVLRATPAPVQ